MGSDDGGVVCGVVTVGRLLRALDGQTLADQSAATQRAFRAVWSARAEQQRILEHHAALTGSR